MNSIALFPYIKWFVLIPMVFFYAIVYKTGKHRILLGIHFINFILYLAPMLYFKALDVSIFNGFYTDYTIQILFLIGFVALSVFLFRNKETKLYRKIIVGLALISIIFVFCIEYLLISLGGFRDYTDKTYKITRNYTLRKEFIDYGRPRPYSVETTRFLLFKKCFDASRQMGTDDFDSLKFVSFKNDILKFNIYLREERQTIWILTNYDENDNPDRGLIQVTKNAKDGFVDLNGNIVIPLEYDHLDGFNDSGECLARKAGKVGQINRKNKIVQAFK